MPSLIWIFASLLASAAPSAAPLAAAAPDLDRFACLAEAYPDADLRLEVDAGEYVVHVGDGPGMRWDDGRADKTLDQMLTEPDLQDTLAMRYPIGPGSTPPGRDEDPGRVRVAALSHALYGATKGEVRRALVKVDWLPEHGGRPVYFNGRHGAAAALKRVSDDLAALPPAFHRYVKVTAGTFNWRTISGTDRLSAHSHGIAIDIDVKHSHYWRWSLKREPHLPWRNAIPLEVAEIFERHGFIWGGKWHHYDTMHFEYRPELLHPRCVERRP